eukprot:5363632-Amphidinium_carterae.1
MKINRVTTSRQGGHQSSPQKKWHHDTLYSASSQLLDNALHILVCGGGPLTWTVLRGWSTATGNQGKEHLNEFKRAAQSCGCAPLLLKLISHSAKIETKHTQAACDSNRSCMQHKICQQPSASITFFFSGQASH